MEDHSIYQFSRSSQELLLRCISVANNRGTKWIELFRPTPNENEMKQENVSFGDDNVLLSPRSIIELADDQPPAGQHSLSPKRMQTDKIERIAAILEAEPANKVGFIVSECNNDCLLASLADKLTASCIETVCEDVLRSRSHDDVLKHFLPAYFIRETPTMALQLLVRAYDTHRATVLALIESLLFKTDSSTKLLEEFFNTVSKSARTEFLQAISLKELPVEAFKHHINVINQLYKTSDINNDIQNFLLNELLRSAEICTDDKNYGRCLLTFFGRLKENRQTKRQPLERLLATHNTAFKRPCQSILHDLYKEK